MTMTTIRIKQKPEQIINWNGAEWAKRKQLPGHWTCSRHPTRCRLLEAGDVTSALKVRRSRWSQHTWKDDNNTWRDCNMHAWCDTFCFLKQCFVYRNHTPAASKRANTTDTPVKRHVFGRQRRAINLQQPPSFKYSAKFWIRSQVLNIQPSFKYSDYERRQIGRSGYLNTMAGRVAELGVQYRNGDAGHFDGCATFDMRRLLHLFSEGRVMIDENAALNVVIFHSRKGVLHRSSPCPWTLQ